jgi:hypothetical protein
MGSQVEGVAYLVGVGDVAFYDDRYVKSGKEGLKERPRGFVDGGGVGGVAAKGCGDGVGSGAFGGEGVFEGGDVGEDGKVEFGVDAGNECGEGFGFGEAAERAVEGDDVSACFGDGFGGGEVRGDVDIAVGIEGLGDADDWQRCEGAEGGDARGTFGSETACSAAKD